MRMEILPRACLENNHTNCCHSERPAEALSCEGEEPRNRLEVQLAAGCEVFLPRLRDQNDNTLEFGGSVQMRPSRQQPVGQLASAPAKFVNWINNDDFAAGGHAAEHSQCKSAGLNVDGALELAGKVLPNAAPIPTTAAETGPVAPLSARIRLPTIGVLSARLSISDLNRSGSPIL